MSADDMLEDTRLGWRARVSPARLSRETPVVQLIVLIAIVIYALATLDGFGSAISIKSTLVIASFLGLASVGESVLVLLGYFDLSIAGFIGLGNVLTAVLVGQDHWGFVPAIGVIIGLSIALGGLSGLICHFFNVQSIVVTLGMNFILLGGIAVLTRHGITGQAPAWLTQFASVSGSVAGVKVPPVVILWLVVAVVVGVMLRYTVVGRRTYLTGSSPHAAELALVSTRRIVIGAFALSAVAAAITGVLLTGFSGTGDPSIGDTYLFTSITAVVVGGTSFVGGRGSYWHTVIGAIMLTVINTILVAKGYGSAQQQTLFGIILLIVALAYSREPRLRDRI